MKKIIGMIKPFQMEQSLIVFEDGNKIDILNSSMENLNQDIYNLMTKHECNRLDLAGPRKYMQGVADQIKKDFITSYNLTEIEINVI